MLRGLLLAAVSLASLASFAASSNNAVATGSASNTYRAAHSHQLKLSQAYRPTGEPVGAFVAVHINGSAKSLRLLLDSGVSNIVIGSEAAERIGFVSSTPARISGFGSGSRRAATAATASIETSGVRINPVVVRVVTGKAVSNFDGLIGLDTFRDYLVDWDIRRGVIQLSALENDQNQGVPVKRIGHLLFVEASCSDQFSGYGLLDTGAAFSAIANESAGRANGPSASDRLVSVGGVTGNVPEAVRLGPVRFQLGDARLVDREPLGMDLSSLSKAHGLRIAAVIGYPALRNARLTINYRAGTVRISD